MLLGGGCVACLTTSPILGTCAYDVVVTKAKIAIRAIRDKRMFSSLPATRGYPKWDDIGEVPALIFEASGFVARHLDSDDQMSSLVKPDFAVPVVIVHRCDWRAFVLPNKGVGNAAVGEPRSGARRKTALVRNGRCNRIARTGRGSREARVG
jgi:hypothetical protein